MRVSIAKTPSIEGNQNYTGYLLLLSKTILDGLGLQYNHTNFEVQFFLSTCCA